MNGAIRIAIIAAIVAILAFCVWLFWTVSGMLLEIFSVTKYGWPLQLVIFLLMWGICTGFGVRVK
jgi:cell division protein FtsX